MWEKLAEVERRYEELGEQLAQPEVINNRQLFLKLSREHNGLTEIVATYRAHQKAKQECAESRELSSSGDDPSLREMAAEEAKLLEGEVAGLEQRLKLLLVPKDPNDEKNVILEIRAGAGGDEAGLFAAELYRMYTKYAEARGWKVEFLGASEAGAGGFKEVIAMLNGAGAFSRLKYESGVHRVQRVPETEASGRVHTSTVTVAVLPEAEEVDVQINEQDLKIDVFRAGGHGGQSVNTTDSAVRMTHLPTGLVVVMRDEKSQHKNRDKALRILRARLLEKRQNEADQLRSSERKGQIGTGDRSEKIRTYNFPQSRITDHRVGLSVHNIQEVLEGDLDTILDPLIAQDQAEKLQGGAGVLGGVRSSAVEEN